MLVMVCLSKKECVIFFICQVISHDLGEQIDDLLNFF